MKQAKKEKVFRIVYEIEYEYFQEQSGQSEQIITVKKKSESRHINSNTPFGDSISSAVEYIDKHLPAEIEDTIKGLYGEGRFAQWENRNHHKDTRDLILNALESANTKKRRKRLYVNQGPTPRKTKRDFIQKKNQFISDCIKILKDLRKKEIKLTQKNVADRYITDRHIQNKVKQLTRDLKEYGITWKKLLAKTTL